MSALRTSNPVFSDRVLQQFSFAEESTTMTANGTVLKTTIALAAVMLTAGIAWINIQQGAAPAPYLYGGMIVGLVLALITSFKPALAPYTTPVYALAEGAFLGAISVFIQSRFPETPIVFQAVCLTFGTLFVMLICYQTRVIRVTDKLRSGIVVATGAICLLYLVSFVLSFFGTSVPFIHGSGLVGIGFSLFVVGLAAFNLLLDFDLVDRLVAQRAPKAMEWYAAFALLVTLIWLYIEILRLLSKLNRRD
ncbi:MAG: Bax inhibitor-1/YccA family protein [Fuerstiella sp.]|nr:Bax inhibitor-1/YccA family protein [Fuerstiella sp.]